MIILSNKVDKLFQVFARCSLVDSLFILIIAYVDVIPAQKFNRDGKAQPKYFPETSLGPKEGQVILILSAIKE